MNRRELLLGSLAVAAASAVPVVAIASAEVVTISLASGNIESGIIRVYGMEYLSKFEQDDMRAYFAEQYKGRVIRYLPVEPREEEEL